LPRLKAMGSISLKTLGRWVSLGAALGFLLHTLVGHQSDVRALHLDPWGWGLGLAALGLTLGAHAWSGWTWSWTLQALQQNVSGRWSTLVYLQTNLLKYLPGNVWHFLGRVRALQSVGIDRGSAIVGVALEPLLMVAAALILGVATPTRYWVGQLLLLGLVLEGLRPRWLNPMVQRWGRSKAAAAEPNTSIPPANSELSSPALAAGLSHYPLKPLASQIGYILLRGLSFTLVLRALTPLTQGDWPRTLSAFSLAWLAGLVVPGAPGGLGVFEAIALGLLQGAFSPAAVLGAVLLYRLVNTLAEALGFALATLAQRLTGTVG
jgi:glycosyltransferase 2 family protein